MTRYRVPVADQLLLDKDFWVPVEGFRLISVDGPWMHHPDVTICTFEDDNAPDEVEGRLVEPVFQKNTETGAVTVMSRSVVTAA